MDKGILKMEIKSEEAAVKELNNRLDQLHKDFDKELSKTRTELQHMTETCDAFEENYHKQQQQITRLSNELDNQLNQRREAQHELRDVKDANTSLRAAAKANKMAYLNVLKCRNMVLGSCQRAAVILSFCCGGARITTKEITSMDSAAVVGVVKAFEARSRSLNSALDMYLSSWDK